MSNWSKMNNVNSIRNARRSIALTASASLVWSMLAGIAPAQAEAAETAALPLYLQAKAPVEQRVSDLLGRMNLDEKVGQMVQAERASVTPQDVRDYYLGSVLSGGGSFPNGKQSDSTREKWAELVDGYQTGAISTRLGIPILYGVDAIHGNSNLIGATLFPHNIGLGATRNAALVEQIGAATASEVKAAGTNWAFAPTIADPQNINWGRTYEGFGDNQQLVAEMGAAFVKGLQGESSGELAETDRVVSSVKHFLGEGLTDGGANQGDITGMTEAEVAALNLPMYKAAIDAGARTVMASYNSIKGIKMHANKRLLTDLLKGTGDGQLGFTGFVISDYNAVQQITKDWEGNAVSGLKNQIGVAVNAGVDMMMMPTDWKSTIDHLKALVGEGAITQERIDDAVTRILRVKFESGVFEHPMTDQSLAEDFGSDAHRELARQAAAESLVLLKNDKPKDSEEPIMSLLAGMEDIFVAGKSADDIGLQAGGWSISWQGAAGKTTEGTTLLQGIREVAGDSKKITYNKHGRGAAGHDVAIVFVGEKPYAESNGDALNKLQLDNEDLATLDNVKSSGVPTVVVLVSGRPLIVNDRLGDWDALVAAWLPGTEGAGVADVLLGDKDFAGKLPVRWPFYTEAYTNPAAGKSNLDPQYVLFDYGYGLTKAQETPALKPVPAKPGDNAPYVKVEAESFTAKSDGLKTENTSDTGGGQNIGYTSKDQWLEYRIKVETAGTYDIDFRYAGGEASITNSGFRVLNAAGATLGTLSGIGHTGGWQTWKTATLKDVALEAGEQTIKLVLVDGGLNFNWFGSEGFVPAPPATGGPGGEIEPQAPVEGGVKKVESWISTERDSQSMKWYYAPQWQAGDEAGQLTKRDENLDLTAIGDDADVTTIKINPSKTYQSMMGIGSSMEESTVYNLIKMSPAKQDELIKKLVNPDDGIGVSMTRVTIGTADFTARKFYSYDDMPLGQTDTALANFSIQKDIDFGIIDALKRILKHNPNMQFFASPWSPPGWMKTTDSMIKGSVKDEYLPVLADYYVKFIQAYKAQGINISAMTLQNEPLLEIEYPSTKMPWQQEAELAKLLSAKLKAAGLDVKLWIFDHNFNDTMSYPAPLLADSANRKAVDGTAFHDYGGEPTEMSRLHDMYPDENIYLTERAVWGTTGADRMAQYFRNWARSYNSWVLMLDSDINTHQWVGTPDPTMIVQDSGNPENYWLTPEFYMLGNYTKFVKPGYIRIDSNYGSKDSVTNVSFMSPDKKKIVTVVINRTDKQQTFKIVSDGTQIADTIPAKSVITYQWDRLATDEFEPATISANPAALPYNVHDKEITLTLDGGTFVTEKLGEITLGSEAQAMGITIGKVTYDGQKSIGQPSSIAVNAGEEQVAEAPVGDGSGDEAAQGEQPEVGEDDASTPAEDAVAGEVADPAEQSVAGAEEAAPETENVNDETATTSEQAAPIAGVAAPTAEEAAGDDAAQAAPSAEEDAASADVNELATAAALAAEGPTSIRIQLLWDNTKPYYANTKLNINVPASAYRSDSGGASGLNEALIASVMLEGTGYTTEPIDIGAGPVNANQYYQLSGTSIADAGTANARLNGFATGDWADFKINVPAAGKYAVTAQVASPNGGGFMLQSDGGTLGTYVIPNLYGSTAWVGARLSVELKAGVQTLRVMGISGEFDVKSIAFEPSAVHQANNENKLHIEAEQFTAAGQQVIQYGSNRTNLGYTVAGSTFDYAVDIPADGYYKVTLQYATPQGGVSAAITANDAAMGSFALPSTGGWEVYKTEFGVVHLNAGVQTLRIADNGDGFNLDWLTIEPGEPVATKQQAATPKAVLSSASNGAKQVAISTATIDAKIHYTTDGTLPTAASSQYAGPIVLMADTVIRAIAVKDGMTDSYAAYFSTVPVSGIKLQPIEVTLGSKQRLVPVFRPAIVSNDAVTWSTSNPSVATIDGTGQVTALALGTTTIKVITQDGGREATAELKVVNQSTGPVTVPPVAETEKPSSLLLEPKVDASGNAVVTISVDQVKRAFEQLANKQLVVQIKPAAGLKQVTVGLPIQAIQANQAIAEIRFETELGSLTVNKATLTGADGKSPERIQFTAKLASVEGTQLKSGVSYAFALQADGKAITELSGGNARIAFPYSLQAGEKPHAVVVYAIDEQGNAVLVKNARFNADSGLAQVSTGSLGQFAALYANVTFSDVRQAVWAQESIEALAARGAINGIGNGQFAPNSEVTRAAFIKMMLESFAFGSGQGEAKSFSDVGSEAWYADAVAQAQALGLVHGKPDGTFGANEAITREEMAMILFRAAELLELAWSNEAEDGTFKDESTIAGYAKEAVDRIQAAGLMKGLPDGSFGPKVTASRAQAASVIYALFKRGE
ncbi:glycoside hydrolase family 3 N-terminal domain-containing protein [Paenibacillus methanolicus]|uniref:beta-glucosidase n=1 Tax=Paenibacillus methanolicus TaxID=582686 RepID=A0A5S5CMA5_9BACL|nr:glycoside hydrolase family 3 N-terminal domain-containing protein [Paenibacillus methanolicus]TYP79785.1 beta-glucosidase-like glycosyl hydrolase [Paenibacillus methanolicus]